MPLPSQDQLRFILESAILAPSADNHHRIRFEVGEGGLNLWSTQDALSPPGSYKRVLDLLSLGTVAENIALASRRYSLRTEIVLLPEPGTPQLLLRMEWQAAGAQADPLWEAIPLRHTNRQVLFRGPDLSAAEAVALAQAGNGAPDIACTWLDTPSLRGAALRLMRWAEGERFRNRVLHEELFAAIRFDVGWHSVCEEGLPPGALAIEPPLRPAFALLRHWPVMRALNAVGGHYLLGIRAAYLPCRLAPHLGLISAPDGEDVSIFAAGRVFERIWLTAAKLGLALQPFPAAALYAMEGACLEGVPGDLQQRLRQGWQLIAPGRVPLMLFRLGRASPPIIRAGRRPLAAYLTSK